MSLVTLALLLAAPVARADIPPPPGFVESCTVEKQKSAGERCEYCSGAYHGDTTFCERQFAGQPLSRRCRTNGASVWGEVWCGDASAAAPVGPGSEPAPAPVEPGQPAPEPAATLAPAPPATGGAAPNTEKRACAVVGGSVPGGGLALALGLLGLRRRRATHLG